MLLRPLSLVSLPVATTVAAVASASLSFALSACSVPNAAGIADRVPGRNIVGGKGLSSASIGADSVVALMNTERGSLCTGTLVASNLVVTAGHCQLDGGMTHVVFGTSVDSPTAEAHSIVDSGTRFSDPEKYPVGDVAWVKFSGKAPSGYKPARIIPDSLRGELTKGLALTLVGYGQTGDGESKPAGRRLTVNSIFGGFADPAKFKDVFEVGPLEGHGECHGDSGGPAFATVKGETYVLSTLSGLEESLTPELSCESGHVVHNFLGAYKSWISSSSGIALP